MHRLAHPLFSPVVNHVLFLLLITFVVSGVAYFILTRICRRPELRPRASKTSPLYLRAKQRIFSINTERPSFASPQKTRTHTKSTACPILTYSIVYCPHGPGSQDIAEYKKYKGLLRGAGHLLWFFIALFSADSPAGQCAVDSTSRRLTAHRHSAPQLVSDCLFGICLGVTLLGR